MLRGSVPIALRDKQCSYHDFVSLSGSGADAVEGGTFVFLFDDAGIHTLKTLKVPRNFVFPCTQDYQNETVTMSFQI